MPRGLLLLIEHPEKPEQRLAAVWLQDNSPWRCIECSSCISWMLNMDAKQAEARLAREGYVWEKFLGDVREIG